MALIFAVRRATTQCLLLAWFATVAMAAESTGNLAIFKTTDRGRSWSRSDHGLPGKSRINAFGALGDSIFAGTDSGIFLSVDAGQSWRAAQGPQASPDRITSFAVWEQKAFAGTDRAGMLVSSDQGNTWSHVTRFAAKNVRRLQNHGGKIYAGTDAEGVFVSQDGGQSWTPMNLGLPAPSQIFALAEVGGHLFAGLYSQGLFKWLEPEQRWVKTGQVVPLALAPVGGTLLAGHNPGGIFWSGDQGATWTKAAPSLPSDPTRFLSTPSGELADNAPVWEMAAGENLALAGAAAGIYYSEDQGHSWTRARVGLPAESPGIAFLLKGDLILAAALIKDP